MKLKKTLAHWKETYYKPGQCIRNQRHHLADKDPYSPSYGFSSTHVWVWEMDHREHWGPRNWCFWTVVLVNNSFDSPLDYKEIKSIKPQEKQIWIFIGRTDAEAEAPILWPTDAKSQLNRKDPDAGKNWRQKETAAEVEAVRQHHWLYGQESEQTPGDSEGLGILVCSLGSQRVGHDLATEQQQ